MVRQLIRSIACWAILMLTGAGPVWAQFGLGKHKEPSDKAPELTDNDKTKLAEIEQRPEIKEEIDRECQQQQREDMEYAYAVNSSVRFADLSSPQYAEFRLQHGQLYDNPMFQQYINHIGQSLVPKDSPHVYSFKLLLDPVPQAEALTTGTIYVSTGLVALLDNEAQLAYVLAHEIGHVEYNHRCNAIKDHILEMALDREKEKSANQKRGIITAVTAGVGAGLGGWFGGGRGASIGLLAGGLGGLATSFLTIHSKTTYTEWPQLNENEADEAGFKYMLERNYDVREVPRVYAHLDGLVTKDTRVGLGFIGKPSRLKERSSHIQSLISDSYKAKIEAKAKALKLNVSSADFPVLMSALKCDNGIIALDYDLFAEARDNLEEAVALRPRYPRAETYLGKVIALTARTQEDQMQAMQHFVKAMQGDKDRGAYPEPHLQRALFLIAENNPSHQEEIRNEIKAYVALYQRENRGSLPGHMAVLYDYFALQGDMTWYVAPTSEVSTRYDEPLNVSNTESTGAPGAQQVVGKALEKSTQSIGVKDSDSGRTPPIHKKNISGTQSQ